MIRLAGLWNFDRALADGSLFHVAPASESTCRPVNDAYGAIVLFDGRLDNRPELTAVLADAIPPDAPDAEIVLRAWRKWGDACFARLVGDFAVALFDPSRQTLVLARDAVGCRPLYYWSDARRLIFASEIKAILAHPDVSTAPNEDLLADLLLLDQLPYEDDGETFFRGISAVLPGYLVRVGVAGIKSERYWDFRPDAWVRYRSYADYADHLRALLLEAVTRRLRSDHPIAVATSGGLDSSIVLCLVDDLRRNAATGSSLVPLSCQISDDPATEENRFIQLLENERGLRIGRLALDPPGDVTRLERLIGQSETPLVDDGWCALSPLLVEARRSSATVLLTGMWSDQLCFSTGYLVDLFWKLQWRRISRHIDEYTRWFIDADPAYFRRRFRRDVLHSLTPPRLRSTLRPFRTAFARRRGGLPIGRALAAKARRRRPRVRHPDFASVHARHVYQAVRAKARRLQMESDAKMAAGYGLDLVSPFLDRDVIAFLMNIPGDIQNHHGVPRALLRDAMRGLVPEPILRRRWRDDTAFSQERQLAYRSAHTSFPACASLGFVSGEAPFDDGDSLPFIGLEVWSRVFFSATL